MSFLSDIMHFTIVLILLMAPCLGIDFLIRGGRRRRRGCEESTDNSQEPSPCTNFFMVLLENTVIATIAALVFAVIAVFMFDKWILEAVSSPRLWATQPTNQTFVLCLLAIVVLGLSRKKQATDIWISGILGLFISFLLFGAADMSRRPGVRLVAILSGEYALFLPLALCIGSCVGVIVGQNLVEMRRLLAVISPRSPRLFEKKENDEVDEDQG